MPELYEDHCQYVYQRALELWEKGLIDIDFLADEPRVSMNEAGYLALEQRSSTADDRHFLRELDRIIANNAH
jgi:orotate phosphoribosyltransferase-like protein